ncbi:ROK family transcriptional regulator [Nonomuraea sediminis]|uniref:ROK family transcriptional regulator n=1 Tax=Nonomuraea sediminis TaxID=2835864 RepID=UPI001BDD9E40|nr:ROK family transcriptional regulator [Nonomuraea sediminis]
MTNPRTADPMLMRRLNEVATMRVLLGRGELTMSRILELTGLSRSTGEAVLETLIADGWVREVPPEQRQGVLGRPARTFRFLAEARQVMAVEIGAHHVAAMVADLDGTVRETRRRRTTRSASRAERLEAVRTVIGTPPPGLLAVAVGTPGLVGDDGAIRLCRVLPEWTGLSPAAELGELFDCPIAVENDVNLSALAERWTGAAAGVDDLVWASLGRSTAAAVVLRGRLHRGATGAAGELGWVPELGWAQVRDHPLSFAGLTGTSHGELAARLIDTARAGDAEALAEFDRFASLAAPGLSAIVLAYDPRALVLGGAPAAAPDLFVPALSRHLAPRCLSMPELHASALGEEAAITGALRLALDRAEARLYSTEERLLPR